jgi:hypothetical protein
MLQMGIGFIYPSSSETREPERHSSKPLNIDVWPSYLCILLDEPHFRCVTKHLDVLSPICR